VEIDGLRPFLQGLKSADTSLPKVVQEIHKRIATETVENARSDPGYSGSQGGRLPDRRVRDSYRARASQRESFILAGGPKAPEFYGQEFGGQERPTTMQFPPHKGTEGYSLYPKLREQTAEIEGRYFDEIADALEQAFPK
jgi:hypothetical protein